MIIICNFAVADCPSVVGVPHSPVGPLEWHPGRSKDITDSREVNQLAILEPLIPVKIVKHLCFERFRANETRPWMNSIIFSREMLWRSRTVASEGRETMFDPSWGRIESLLFGFGSHMLDIPSKKKTDLLIPQWATNPVHWIEFMRVQIPFYENSSDWIQRSDSKRRSIHSFMFIWWNWLIKWSEAT